MKAIYKVTVTNWEKHNPKAKKSYKMTMLNTRFFEDAKIQMLSPGARLVFIGLILACGDLGRSSVEASHEVLVRWAGGTGQQIQRLLNQLQSLQLVSYEIVSLIEVKRREKKLKEEKRREAIIEKEEPPQAALVPSNSLHPLAEIWNEHCGALPKVQVTLKQRLKKCESIWKQCEKEKWVEIVKRMAASNFLTGKNDKGWIANFDFFIKPDTWAKVVEGNYDNRTTAASTAQSRKYDKLDELEQIWKQKAGEA